jgi:hypothetical protein
VSSDTAVRVQQRFLAVVGLAGLIALAVGLAALAPSASLGFDPIRALTGAAGELPLTLPAGLTVLAVTGLELGAGLILLRFARREPYTSISDAILSGLVGAVLKDVALLAIFGQFGLFNRPLLLAVDGAILVAGWRARPHVEVRVEGGRLRRIPLGIALLAVATGLVWLGPLLLQLASPVVPFIDVLPNHVAPAEHLRVFGGLDPLTATQSPIYGPSRTLLGFVALSGAITTMAGFPAVLAIAALILPTTLLVAAGIHRLASAIGGDRAGWWALFAFTLTASFARLGDVRATVVVLPLVAWSLAFVADRLAARPTTRGRLPDGVLLGLALGAAVLVHPVMGALAVAVVGLVAVVARARTGRLGAIAIAVAAVMSLPQGLTMLGVGLPAASLAVAGASAVVLGLGLERVPSIHLPARHRRTSTILGVGFGALLAGLVLVAILDGVVGSLLVENAVLLLLFVGGLAVRSPAVRSPVVLGATTAGIIVAIGTAFIPAGAGTLGDALRFELPKTLYYWLPVVAAVAAGSTLAALCASPAPSAPRAGGVRGIASGRRAGIRAAALGLVVVACMLPLRVAPIDAYWLGDHRFSEALAIDLHFAEYGFWTNFPDSRLLVDRPRRELIEAVRSEIDGGRIGPDTPVLHVARSFQEWVATPLGVFTGVMETDVSLDPEHSIHTVGGRLHGLAELPAMLASRSYPYVLLEPGLRLPAGLGDAILAAGYRPVFGNGEGVLYRLTGA